MKSKKKDNQDLNNFYVYEWFNIDTGEVFYVGKGKGNRYKNVSKRNQYFINYYNKYKCDVRKVEENLEETIAFGLEIELIKKYQDIGQCKCNFTDGGEGVSLIPGTWSWWFRKLTYLYYWDKFEDMPNSEEYTPNNFKLQTVRELEKMYRDYREEIDDMRWLKSLDIWDEDGHLNLGWECFED